MLLSSTMAAAVACGRRDAPAGDSLADSVQPAAETRATGNWVAELGDVLVVPSDSENTGVVLFPALPSPRLLASTPLTLLSPSGDSVTARAALVVSDSQVCGEAPTIRLSGSVASDWTVGLLARTATPLPMDSIEALAAPDSARLAADLARLASTLPTTAESRFTALPFVVLGARRLESRGKQIVVAHLVRRLPQEATPLEEHTLVIVERDASAKTRPYLITYHERSEGTEETADHYDVLSAIGTASSTFLVLSRDQEARTSYEILERVNPGSWRTRWLRTLAC